MTIFETVDYSLFESRFKDYDRLHHFPKGLRALFNYLEEASEEVCQPLELDVIGLCCDFSEDIIENVLENYGLESLDELRDNTTVIEVDSETIVYQVY